MQPGLYIVGTPIGNLEDITLRALETLKDVSLILAEDTRRTRKLLNRYEIRTPLTSCHKFNEASRTGLITTKIGEEGEAVALVSNAGMPVVSDPGARMVSACRQAGLHVEVIPGPSAVTSAVALSGFQGRGFTFEGFLSHKGAARKRRLEELATLSHPLVLFESPHRIMKLLDELEDTVGDRQLFVGRELTKRYEECILGEASAVREALGGRAVKGELVVVVAPASRTPRKPVGD